MAAFLHFLLLLCSFLHNLNTSQSKPTHPQPKGAIFHVTKDVSTLQYVTQIQLGTPLNPTNLVIDLAGPSLWLACSPSSSSRALIPQSSIKCLSANPITQNSKSKKCETLSQNRVTQMATLGDLAQDIIALPVVHGSITSHFLFSCAPKLLLNGLATGARGMLGLGITRASAASQVAAALDSKPQFILCLSPSNGVVLHHSGQFGSSFVSGVSDSLAYTSLVTQVDSPHEYFINFKSIRVNGKLLALNYKQGLGGIKLSTVVPYSTMESSIYAVFVRAFEQAAVTMNMTRVASVAPFGLCFGYENIDGSTRVGSRVPVVDLGLQSEMVKWRLDGGNSMVQVSDEVVCLGFLDGGLEQKTSIVLGGHQLENTLLHFDLGAYMLGISSSKMDQNICSDLGLGFGFKDSI